MSVHEAIPQPMASPAPQRRSLKKKVGQHQPSTGAFTPFTSPSTGRRRKDIGDYWLGHTLGKGSSGRVKLGIHKETGQKVAIKIISKTHLASNGSIERAVKREIAVMKLIDHPNIISLIDVIDLSDSPNLYLVLEYVEGGELFEYLVSQGRLCESEARRYFQQIIFGLEFCHRHLICHRDLKPENLLLDENKNIKIADFGMASLQPAGSMLETSCGSPHYASPEIVAGIPYNGSASDIWSCGIILFALLCGHLPFDDENIRLLLTKVKNGKYKIPDHVSNLAKDLIAKILVIDPKDRYKMEDIQSHTWFTTEKHYDLALLPQPPTPEEIGMPLKACAQMDDRILETLKILWGDLSKQDILNALLSHEHNMQKVTYVLLQRRANKYWEVGHPDDDIVPTTPAKRRRPVTICAVGINRNALPGIASVMASDSQNTTSSQQRPAPTFDGIDVNRDLKNTVKKFESIDTSMDRNDIDMDLPPPVPPKPIIIRADLIYNQIMQNIENSVGTAKKHSSLPPNDFNLTSPLPTVAPSPSPRRQSFVNSIATPRCNRSVFGGFNSSQAPPMPTQQHLGVEHMISPRAKQASKFISVSSRNTIDSERRAMDNDTITSPSAINNTDDHRRFSRSLRLLQRNKVDSSKATKASHRFSMPAPHTKTTDCDQKVNQYTPIFGKKESKAQLDTIDGQPTAVHIQGILAQGSSSEQSSLAGNMSPYLTSPRLSSWIPGLFYFKQPKICSIGCVARGEFEAIEKVKKVVEEHMDGRVSVRSDKDGFLRCKGEMRYRSATKITILKFKIQVFLPPQIISDSYMARIDFIQQQGDAMALSDAVATIGQILRNYELDADLISTANGWLMRQDGQDVGHQRVC